jgi:polyisoprenoid-binding protein YceI
MAAMTTITPTLPLSPGRWTLDPAHSSVGFTIRHLGVSKVRGRFTRFETEVVVGDTVETSSVTATVDVASIDTANADRDAHVLSADILDVARRPTLPFRSTRVHGEQSNWTIDGELTLGDVTRPVTLTAELGGVGTFVDGSRHAGFEATAQIRRKDFGISLPLPADTVLGDIVKIELDLQLTEPADA